MLEVLITLFILSVGLLGLAAMQTEGLKTGSGSLLRSKAVVAMADITDRMRANAAGLNNYQLPLTLAATITKTFPSGPPDYCATKRCSATEMAQFDMDQWLYTLQAPGSGLPGARAAIALVPPPLPPAVPVRRFTFTVSWTDRQANEAYITEVLF